MNPWFPSRRLFRLLAVLSAALATTAVFFRVPLLSGFRMLSGDDSDTLIELSILEHWRAVFAGAASWTRTSYFFPHPDTLGYNDGYLLYGIVYAVLRLLRIDPFLSGELVNVACKLLGFAGFVLFSRRVAGLPLAASLLGAVLFTLANNSFLQVGHAQLLSVALVPILGLLLAQTLRDAAAGRPRPATGWSAASAALFGGWLLTSFYTAWFFCLLCLAALGAAAALSTPAERRVVLARAGWLWRQHRRLLGINALCWLGCLLPFARVYLPTALQSGGHDLHDVANYWPSIPDLLHVGHDSVLFGRLDDALARWRDPNENAEHLVGFSPGMASMALLGALSACYPANGGRAAPPPRRLLLFRVLALALLFCLLLVVHVRSHSLWPIVFHAVPGAKGIRCSGRLLLVLAAPAALLAALGFERLRRAGLPRIAAATLGLLLVAGELNGAAYDTLSRPLELRRMALIRPTPLDCRAFYATGSAADQRAIPGLYHPNVDAMLIGALRDLPTVNGFSTFNPPDWAFDAASPDYLAHVGIYALLHRLDHLCGLDVGTGTWTRTPPPRPALPFDRTVPFDGSADGSAFLGGGWGIEEAGGGIWSTQQSAKLVFIAPTPAHDLVVELSLLALARPNRPDRVVITLNDQPPFRFDLDGTPRTIRLHLSREALGPDNMVVIAIRKPVLRRVRDVSARVDPRRLGVYLRSIRLRNGD